jgi:hypothetical protein
MKRFVLCLVMATAALAADKPVQKKSAKAAPQPARTVTLPAGAVAVEPGTYRYTDPQGKKWVYRQTPFGLARIEDKPAAAEEQKASSRKAEEFDAQVTAVEQGDTIHFTRSGPFGQYKWQRKKSDLDDSERAIWERSRTKSASSKGSQE